jgi:RimJ/RimL family protein N-acetyltransferase
MNSMTEFEFTTFPTLTTPRLILRQINAGDAADMLSMNSDPEVLKYDVDPPMRDIPEALVEIGKYTQMFTEKKAIGWGVCLQSNNRLIGDFVFFFYDQAYYKLIWDTALLSPTGSRVSPPKLCAPLSSSPSKRCTCTG